MKRVRCADCLNSMEYITNRGRHVWCESRRIWIPARKYYRRRKCSKFGLNPIAQTAIATPKLQEMEKVSTTDRLITHESPGELKHWDSGPGISTY